MASAPIPLRVICEKRIVAHDLAKDRYWVQLLRDVGRTAVAAAAGEDELDDYLYRGFGVVEGLCDTLNPHRWADPSKQLIGWHHRDRLDLATKKIGDPYLPRLDAEAYAGSYLALPYRVDALDRLFVDILMAAEILAFADEMKPLLKRRLPHVLRWLLSNVVTLLVGLSLVAFTLWIGPDSTTAYWIAGVVAVLTLGSVAWSLVAFPFAYPAIRRAHQQFDRVVASMMDAYAAMSGSPASTRHIQERVQRAIECGVVWPAPLMALLDDIEARRRTM